MQLKALGEFERTLYGCRFCPMCKPAAEVGNLTLQEGHGTRGRAMLIWRVLKGYDRYDARSAELLYQSTLDSISEAWCVNHFPVSDYVAAARRELFAEGMLPDPVRLVLSRSPLTTPCPRGDTVLFAAEAAELGDADALEPLRELCAAVDIDSGVYLAPSGMLAFALGDVKTARRQAAEVLAALSKARARRVICDGPQALAALKVLYPVLGLESPGGLELLDAATLAEGGVKQGRLRAAASARRVFVHDSRTATLLAETPPEDAVLQPELSREERHSGTGEVYDRPRRLVDALGLERVTSVWCRGLSRSAGSDDGLWLTYPGLAHGLAAQRLGQLRSLGAELVVTDSLLEARLLREASEEQGASVSWLPELVVRREA